MVKAFFKLFNVNDSTQSFPQFKMSPKSHALVCTFIQVYLEKRKQMFF